MQNLLASIATAMSYDVQMVEEPNIVSHECFNNVFLIANHGNSNDTHGDFSNELEN